MSVDFSLGMLQWYSALQGIYRFLVSFIGLISFSI